MMNIREDEKINTISRRYTRFGVLLQDPVISLQMYLKGSATEILHIHFLSTEYDISPMAFAYKCPPSHPLSDPYRCKKSIRGGGEKRTSDSIPPTPSECLMRVLIAEKKAQKNIRGKKGKK